MTQTQLADRMAARKWKWSQSTVWAVESGRRPLRYAEAVDICDILDVRVWELEGNGQDLDVLFLASKYHAAIDNVRDGVRSAAQWQYEMAELFDQFEEPRQLDEEHTLRAISEYTSANLVEAAWQTLGAIAEDRAERLEALGADENARMRKALVASWINAFRAMKVSDDGEHQEEA